jgi:hypothetical protein
VNDILKGTDLLIIDPNPPIPPIFIIGGLDLDVEVEVEVLVMVLTIAE